MPSTTPTPLPSANSVAIVLKIIPVVTPVRFALDPPRPHHLHLDRPLPCPAPPERMDGSSMGSMPSWRPSTNSKPPRVLTPPPPAASTTTWEVQTTISAYGWRIPAPQASVMPSGPSDTKRNVPKKRKKTPGEVTKTKKRMTSRQQSTRSPEPTLDLGGAPPQKNISLSPKLTAPPSTPHFSNTISKTPDAPLSAPLWDKEVKFIPPRSAPHQYQTRARSLRAHNNASSQEENPSPTQLPGQSRTKETNPS